MCTSSKNYKRVNLKWKPNNQYYGQVKIHEMGLCPYCNPLGGGVHLRRNLLSYRAGDVRVRPCDENHLRMGLRDGHLGGVHVLPRPDCLPLDKGLQGQVRKAVVHRGNQGRPSLHQGTCDMEESVKDYRHLRPFLRRVPRNLLHP